LGERCVTKGFRELLQHRRVVFWNAQRLVSNDVQFQRTIWIDEQGRKILQKIKISRVI